MFFLKYHKFVKNAIGQALKGRKIYKTATKLNQLYYGVNYELPAEKYYKGSEYYYNNAVQLLVYKPALFADYHGYGAVPYKIRRYMPYVIDAYPEIP